VGGESTGTAYIYDLWVQRYQLVSINLCQLSASVLDGVSGPFHVVTAVLLGKYPRYTLNTKPSRAPELVWKIYKFLTLAGSRTTLPKTPGS
jgi:hypothetical protein